MNAEPAIASAFRDDDEAPASIAIVGNAPTRSAQGAEIDACDWVVRFNNTAGLGRAMGHRTTHLVLVNRGGQAGEWARDRGFAERRSIRDARTITLAFPRLKDTVSCPDGRDWTDELVERIAKPSSRVDALCKDTHREARDALTTLGARDPNPSTGFLASFALCRRFAQARTKIEVFGFGFEGWSGHPWQAERRWFGEQSRIGRLSLHHP